MIKQEKGFTLVELLITMVLFVFVMAAGSQIFSGLLTQFKQQSKIAETNIEGVIGLEILRQDIEHAGYGLPWMFQNAISYSEAADARASNYNDAPSNPPRGILSGDDINFANIVNGSDYLTIKAINVAANETCGKWTTLLSSPTPFSDTYNPRVWSAANENLKAAEKVIVMSLGGTTGQRMLIMNNANFFDQYSNVGYSPWTPMGPSDIRIVYGVDPDTDLIMPFNRADYFVSVANVPLRCAPNTGVLVKAVMNHNDSGSFNLLPLLDCVADMQVVYALDNNENGSFEDGVGGDTYSDDITAFTAQQVRNRVKEVRIYVLAHEGQRDQNYTYPSENVAIPPLTDPAAGLGRSSPGFNLKTAIGKPDYQFYRWKLYTMVVNPINLR